MENHCEWIKTNNNKTRANMIKIELMKIVKIPRNGETFMLIF